MHESTRATKRKLTPAQRKRLKRRRRQEKFLNIALILCVVVVFVVAAALVIARRDPKAVYAVSRYPASTYYTEIIDLSTPTPEPTAAPEAPSAEAALPPAVG